MPPFSIIVYVEYRKLEELTMLAIIVGVAKYSNKVFTVEQIKQLPEFKGSLTEDNTAYRKRGITCHRAELDNQPVLEGLCGPMWDGDKLRYETWEVYRSMSN